MQAKIGIPGWRGRSLNQLEMQVKVGRRKNRGIKYKRCPVVASVLVLAEPEVSNTSDIWLLLMYECWQSLRVTTVSNTCDNWTA